MHKQIYIFIHMHQGFLYRLLLFGASHHQLTWIFSAVTNYLLIYNGGYAGSLAVIKWQIS